MASKIIKEIIIGLVTCLLAMLLFAVIFYEFIPNRKVVPEVTEYKASEKVSEQLADNVDQANDQVVLTYEVTASDLNNYKIKKDYVPGKANPFATIAQDVESSATTKTDTDGSATKGGTSTETGGTSSDGTTSSTEEPETK